MVQLISLENNELQYPITIEIPEDYWTFSLNVEYSSEENKND